MRWLLPLVLALVGLRCAHAPETAAPSSQPTAAVDWPEPQPPALRLPDSVRPVHYTLDLTLVPAAPTYSGTVTIDLEVREPTRQLWLHAQDLALTRAQVLTGGRTLEARTTQIEEGQLGVLLPETLAAGAAQLVLAFTGEPNRTVSQGLYRVDEKDEPYLYTFFEPTDARRAFPCFDEPGIKVPWRLRFTVKQEHVALANHAIVSEEKLADGLKRVTFADSRPMPSYLVAFMVGPFDIVEAGQVGRQPVPLRFIVPRGRGPETAYAASVTPRIITLLEDYFDQPYPYEKLDVAVVPRYWGTMEHPGLVALGQPLTLIRPGEETTERKRHYANIAIHELGHYWFSAMLTCRWWDDIWLNESLTSWLDRKITDQFEPAWRTREASQSGSLAFALRTDSFVTAPPLRKPIDKAEDIAGAFDNGTTYAKGAALMAQVEAWVHEPKLRDALRAYVREFAWGSVTSEDFLGSMRQHLGADVARSLRSFLNQPGVPRVSAELQCTKGQSPGLRLTQERYLRQGSTDPDPRTWSIPVCVRAEGREARACALLTERTRSLALPGTACPSWVMLNAGGAGYYRSGYTPEQLMRLGALPPGTLSTLERLTFLGDVEAGVDRGDVSLADAWRLVPATAKDPDRLILQRGAGLVSQRVERLPEDVRPLYRAWLRELYGAPARRLGWTPRADESEDTKALRQTLLAKAAFVGEDPELVAEAKRIARAWLADRKSVSPETVQLALELAARDGDGPLYDTMLTQAREAQEPTQRESLLGLLGAFEDPTLIDRTLVLAADDALDARDMLTVLRALLVNPVARPQAWALYRDHFERLNARMRTDDAMGTLRLLSSMCSEAWGEEAEAVLGPKVQRLDGGARMLQRTLEGNRLCARAERQQQPGVVAFLKAHAKGTPAKR